MTLSATHPRPSGLQPGSHALQVLPRRETDNRHTVARRITFPSQY
jgi:hypothetical protein